MVPKKSKTESRLEALAARKAARAASKSTLRSEETKAHTAESSTMMMRGGSSILRSLEGDVKMEWEENDI